MDDPAPGRQPLMGGESAAGGPPFCVGQLRRHRRPPSLRREKEDVQGGRPPNSGGALRALAAGKGCFFWRVSRGRPTPPNLSPRQPPRRLRPRVEAVRAQRDNPHRGE